MHQVLKMHLPLPECVECAHVTLYNATGGLGDYNMEPLKPFNSNVLITRPRPKRPGAES